MPALIHPPHSPSPKVSITWKKKQKFKGQGKMRYFVSYIIKSYRMNENKHNSLRKNVAAIVCWHSSKHFIDLIPKDYKHFSLSFAWGFLQAWFISSLSAEASRKNWSVILTRLSLFSSREKPMFYAIHIHSESIVFLNYVTHRHFVAWRLNPL